MSYINNACRYDSFTYKQNMREYNQIKVIQYVFTMSYLYYIKDVQEDQPLVIKYILYDDIVCNLRHTFKSFFTLKSASIYS